MGRAAVTRFLAPGTDRERGVRIGAEFAAWDDLLARGRAARLPGGRAYVVDPTAGMDSIVALLAVATVPDTTMLWAPVDTLGVPHRAVAPALYEVDRPTLPETDRPLWGVATSGSSGRPKLAIGYADLWELVVLHYQSAVFDQLRGGDAGSVLATCLPLRFSAPFFMTVLPSLLLRRDLVIFPADDWRPVIELAQRRDTVVLGVPAIAAAAALALPAPVDLRRATLLLGGGHLSAERVDVLRRRFAGAAVVNLYGTAETGAIAMDQDPGHNAHVGRPISGKAVWLRDPDADGIGAVAAAGPDCCGFLWRPGSDDPTPTGGFVASTDYGRFDAAGNLCLEGRVDGGEKLKGVLVYPRAIERHLLALDGVTDARVLVRRSAAGLEQLCARVVGRMDEAAVRAHCAALPDIEQPTRIECIAERDAMTAYNAVGKL